MLSGFFDWFVAANRWSNVRVEDLRMTSDEDDDAGCCLQIGEVCVGLSLGWCTYSQAYPPNLSEAYPLDYVSIRFVGNTWSNFIGTVAWVGNHTRRWAALFTRIDLPSVAWIFILLTTPFKSHTHTDTQ